MQGMVIRLGPEFYINNNYNSLIFLNLDSILLGTD